MILYLIIWAINVIHTQSSGSIVKPSRDITGDIINKINDFGESREDYGVQDKYINVNANKIRHKRGESYVMKRSTRDEKKDSEMRMFTKHAGHSHRKRVLNIDTDYDYDYEYLLNEYYEEVFNESRSNTSYRINNKNDTETNILNMIRKLFYIQNNKCSQTDIGLKAIKCLFVDYYNRKQPIHVFVSRLWRIIKTWFLIYIALAIPLWCTRGVCCCCLFCKVFKPHRTIEEAKKYFIMNPPGLLKTTKGHEVLYEPTKSERNTYEAFEHLIRTI